MLILFSNVLNVNYNAYLVNISVGFTQHSVRVQYISNKKPLHHSKLFLFPDEIYGEALKFRVKLIFTFNNFERKIIPASKKTPTLESFIITCSSINAVKSLAGTRIRKPSGLHVDNYKQHKGIVLLTSLKNWL